MLQPVRLAPQYDEEYAYEYGYEADGYEADEYEEGSYDDDYYDEEYAKDEATTTKPPPKAGARG